MNAADRIIYEDVARVAQSTDLTPLKGKKVLLAGASGLLGTYLAWLFYYLNKEDGYGITAHFITRNPVTKKSPLYGVLDDTHFSVVTKDLSAPTGYDEVYDYIIHSAGYGSPRDFLLDPVRTIDVNYVGVKSMLEHMRAKNPQAVFLYMSSSEIYGSPTPENFPTQETYQGNVSVTNNRACYMESKRLAEVLCLAYAQHHNMAIRIARPALSYGPGLTFEGGRVISQFMAKAYHDKAINMVDDGRDLRSFCYMSDVTRQLISILLHAKDIVYNVGSAEEELTVLALAQLIGDIMQVPVTPGPGKDANVIGAPGRVLLGLSKLQSEFGFKPEVSMREGLRRTIDWNLAFMKEA